MKIHNSIFAILALSLAWFTPPNSVLAQGTVNFNNLVSSAGINAPVIDYRTGLGLSGSEYLAGLYAGIPDAPDDTLQLLAPPQEFRTGGFAGYVSTSGGSTRVVPGIPPGSLASFQLRAWSAIGGATYEEAVLADTTTNLDIGTGKSSRVNVFIGGVPDPATGIPSFPANLIGLSGFPIYGIPEPSTIALGSLGTLALLLRCRGKSR